MDESEGRHAEKGDGVIAHASNPLPTAFVSDDSRSLFTDISPRAQRRVNLIARRLRTSRELRQGRKKKSTGPPGLYGCGWDDAC